MRTDGGDKVVNDTPIYRRRSTTALDRCAKFCGFQITINFDLSPKIVQDMAKHKKVVWGDG
jgi:hypothetical protein